MMDAPEPSLQRLRVMDAIDPALARVRAMLFEPFDVLRWLSLGLIIFLECLTSGGFTGGGTGWNTGGRKPPSIDAITTWTAGHLAPLLLIGGLVMLAVLALIVLFQWLSSRGAMMFIRAVALNDTRIAPNWHATNATGNSLFLFRLILAVAALLLFAVLVAVAALIVIVIARNADDGWVWALLVPVIAFAILLFIPLVIIHFLLRNFVAPLMYRFDLTCMQAWRLFRPIFFANIPSLLLFLLYRFLFKIALGILHMLLGCLTCCIGFLPVISQAALAPVYVFDRAFSLYVLGSLGPDYGIIQAPAPAEPASPGTSGISVTDT